MIVRDLLYGTDSAANTPHPETGPLRLVPAAPGGSLAPDAQDQPMAVLPFPICRTGDRQRD